MGPLPGSWIKCTRDFGLHGPATASGHSVRRLLCWKGVCESWLLPVSQLNILTSACGQRISWILFQLALAISHWFGGLRWGEPTCVPPSVLWAVLLVPMHTQPMDTSKGWMYFKTSSLFKFNTWIVYDVSVEPPLYYIWSLRLRRISYDIMLHGKEDDITSVFPT